MKRYEAIERRNTRPGHAPDHLWCVLDAIAIDGVTPGSVLLGVGFAPDFLALAAAVSTATKATLPVHVIVTGEAEQSNPEYARACRLVWRDRTDPHLENMAVVVLGRWPSFEQARAACERFSVGTQQWLQQYLEVLDDSARDEPPVPDDEFVRDMCKVFVQESTKFSEMRGTQA